MQRLLRCLLLLPVLFWLAACATSTQIIHNEKASVQQADYRRYNTVYFIKPKSDPRNVAPRIIDEFRAMKYDVVVADQEQSMAG
ncbi:MAG: hypothetical protein ACOY7J_07865, partial [Pseudomonadota bacterium]